MDARKPYLRHAKHYLSISIETSNSLQHGAYSDKVRNELDAHWPNIECAWRWARSRHSHDRDAAQLCIDYLRSLGDVLSLLKYTGTLIAWSDAALRCSRILLNPGAEAIALLYQGRACMLDGRDDADVAFNRSLQILGALGLQESAPAAALMNLRGALRCQRGRHSEAEAFFRSAASISEAAVGAGHPVTAARLVNLGMLYLHEGRFKEAKPLVERALTVWVRKPGFMHPEACAILNNLAIIRYREGRLNDADRLLNGAIAASDALSPQHPKADLCRGNLAEVYSKQGRNEEAEALLKNVIAAADSAFRSNHANTATSLTNLAVHYSRQGRYAEAEPLLRRAIAILEDKYGRDHPYLERTVDNLAMARRRSGNLDPGLRIMSINAVFG